MTCGVRRSLIVLLLIIVPSVTAGSIAWVRLTHGIRLTVVNHGPEPLTSVIAHVSGNSHAIGDLASGESRTVLLIPRSESHLELTFDDGQGKVRRVNAGGYFEPGYRVTLQVEIQKSKVVRNEQEYLFP